MDPHPHLLYNYIPNSNMVQNGVPMPGYLQGMGPMHLHPNYGYPLNSSFVLDQNKKESIRKGKWTLEEEMYTNKVIEAFNAGTLKLVGMEGTTLRSYLAHKLGCDPMRITKKYTGASCLGKRVYHNVENRNISEEEIEKTRKEIEELETKFKDKLEEIKREKRELMSSSEINEQFISSPAIDALVQNRGIQVAPPWAYGPGQAALAMQSYLSYTNNIPLNAYVKARKKQKLEATGKQQTSSEEGSSNTGDRVAKSSEDSEESSDYSSAGDENDNNIIGSVPLHVQPHHNMISSVPVNKSGSYGIQELQGYNYLPYPLNQVQQPFHYIDSERFMQAYGAGYSHSNTVYFAAPSGSQGPKSLSSPKLPPTQHPPIVVPIPPIALSMSSLPVVQSTNVVQSIEQTNNEKKAQGNPALKYEKNNKKTKPELKKVKKASTKDKVINTNDSSLSAEDHTAASSLLGLFHNKDADSRINGENHSDDSKKAGGEIPTPD